MPQIHVWAFDTTAKYAIVADYDTGQILYEKNADSKMYPSSMSKMMVSYLVFEHLDNGALKLDDMCVVSDYAHSMEGSRMFLEPSSKVSVADLLQGLIVQSGNDASVALAEKVGGTEANFVEKMNAKAKEMGLNSTHFDNSVGYSSATNITTPRDMLVLARNLIKDFPQYYYYNAMPSFKYNNIVQRNRNGALGFMGIDGIKTGHTDAAGFSIALSAKQEDRRIVAILNGMSTHDERIKESKNIVSHAFYDYKKIIVAKQDEIMANAKVLHGKQNSVSLKLGKELSIYILNDSQVGVKSILEYNEPLKAPLEENEQLGTMKILINDSVVLEQPLLAAQSVSEAGFLGKIWDNIKNNVF